MIDVTVIIPTFNRLKSLLVAVDSVFSQPDVNAECIVVDDCSTDGTVEYIRERYAKHTLVAIEKDRRSGPQSSRNQGLSKARGEFVTFLDSDDYFEPNTLAKRIQRCRKDNLDALFSGYRVKHKGHHWDLIKEVDSSKRFCPSDYKMALCDFKIAPMITIMFRRSTNIGLTLDETLVSGHDDDLTLSLIRTCRYEFDDILAATIVQHAGERIATSRNLMIGNAQLLKKYTSDIYRLHGKSHLTQKRSIALAGLWVVAEFKRTASILPEHPSQGSMFPALIFGLIRLPSTWWNELYKRLKMRILRIVL